MPRGKPIIRPFRQGALDAYCGLYSIANAIQHCLGGRHRFNEEQAEALFRYLLTKLAKRSRKTLLEVATVGTDTVDIKFLLPVVAAWVRKHLGYRLAWDQPFRRAKRTRAGAVYKSIETAIGTEGFAAIIGVVGPTHHWSVLTKMTAKRLILLDSGVLHWIPRRRLFDCKRHRKGDDYRLVPEDTFIVSIDRASSFV